MPTAGAAGFHGKLPSRGDFVTRNLPPSFVTPWDEWLQAGIAASRTQLGDGWLPLYLESPIWRFSLAAGVCGPDAWAGVLMPSVDRVGRYFPLTIAASLSAHAHPLATAVVATSWYARAEALAVRALDDDRLDLEHFVSDVAELAPPPDPTSGSAAVAAGPDGTGWRGRLDDVDALGAAVTVVLERMLAERAQAHTLWWTTGGAGTPPQAWVVPSLPQAERYAYFLGSGGRDSTATT